MKLLNLNCQKGLHPKFKSFFHQTLEHGKHRILLLQEASESVIDIARNHPGYNIVRHTTPIGKHSSVCLIHKHNLKCVDSEYHHLDDHNENMFGVMIGAFKAKRAEIVAASVHLPAYIQPKRRKAAIKEVKKIFEKFLARHPKAEKVIMAGDFNSILPWEHARNMHILKNKFVPVRNKRGFTYHSDRLEPDSISSSLVYALGRIGVSFKSTLDHVFVTHKLLRGKKIKVYVLNKEVSDHLPMLIDVR